MGASLVYLNEPNTDIEHETGQNDYLKFAAGSMQGWRLNMVSLLPYKPTTLPVHPSIHLRHPECDPTHYPSMFCFRGWISRAKMVEMIFYI